MIQKKICMLGTFAVGKTSLVSQFVRSIYSDAYHTTVGVKIDKKPVCVGDEELNLILWDIHGEDEFQKIRRSYLRGTSGYLLVVDGTRRETLNAAYEIQKTVEESIGKVPFVVAINKTDRTNEWEFTEDTFQALSENCWTFMETSAKTGEGVEEAFLTLAQKMLGLHVKRKCMTP